MSELRLQWQLNKFLDRDFNKLEDNDNFFFCFKILKFQCINFKCIGEKLVKKKFQFLFQNTKGKKKESNCPDGASDDLYDLMGEWWLDDWLGDAWTQGKSCMQGLPYSPEFYQWCVYSSQMVFLSRKRHHLEGTALLHAWSSQYLY